MIEPAQCPQCGVPVEFHAADGSLLPLPPYLVFVCLTCRTVNRVDADGVPVKPTEDQLDCYLRMPLVQRAIAAAAKAHRERP